jgi:acetyl/propionyl-CoA carboxylase alpha subunit
MTLNRLLIANRGEIAIRISRAAADLGIATVAVYSEDDAQSLYVKHAGSAVRLNGSGVAAYLDIDQIVAAAIDAGCDALHPGYGFLAENPALARRCAERGITFVGPTVDHLDLFGDKVASRDAALRVAVPVLPGTEHAITKAGAHEFLDSLGPTAAMTIKAGGGRSARAIFEAAEIADAYEHGKAINTASFFEVDDVIDPEDSRHWISTALRSIPTPMPRDHKSAPCGHAC